VDLYTIRIISLRTWKRVANSQRITKTKQRIHTHNHKKNQKSDKVYTANEERGKRLEIPEFGGNLGGI
jgi:hypothetical protein